MVRSMWLSSRWSCSFGNDPTILTVVGWTGVASAALTFIHSAMVGLMKRLTDINWGGATLVGARLHRSNFGVCGCGITRDTHTHIHSCPKSTVAPNQDGQQSECEVAQDVELQMCTDLDPARFEYLTRDT